MGTMSTRDIGLVLTLVCVSASASRTVLVTGATGGTGKHIYAGFKNQPGFHTRALVSSTEKARSRLGCDKCDVSEGIFVGDVTKPETLQQAMAGGVTDLAIAVGLGGNATVATMQAVEWRGVQNQVEQLAHGAMNAGIPLDTLHVSLISSMGTTDPNPPAYEGGVDLFWKLQAEAFLQSSGVSFTIIKPCGLSDGPAQNMTLVVGHDDAIFGKYAISRSDVAQVMISSVVERANGVRTDICARPGEPPASMKQLLESARWSWQQ